MYGGANETLLPYGVLGRHSLVSELQKAAPSHAIVSMRAHESIRRFAKGLWNLRGTEPEYRKG